MKTLTAKQTARALLASKLEGMCDAFSGTDFSDFGFSPDGPTPEQLGEIEKAYWLLHAELLKKVLKRGKLT